MSYGGSLKPDWNGVFPAVTTQFRDDLSLDIDATARVMGPDSRWRVGTHRMRDGRRELLAPQGREDRRDGGRQSGRAQATPGHQRHRRVHVGVRNRHGQGGRAHRPRWRHGDAGARLLVEAARDCRAFPQRREATVRCRSWSTTTRRSTRTTSRGNSRFAPIADDRLLQRRRHPRFTDLHNLVGDRFVLFAGLDDVVVESIMVRCRRLVSGLGPSSRERRTLFRLARAGRYAEAMSLYQWFMPLLHLDARPDLVQCIKLPSTSWARHPPHWPPQLPLSAPTKPPKSQAMMKTCALAPQAAVTSG